MTKRVHRCTTRGGTLTQAFPGIASTGHQVTLYQGARLMLGDGGPPIERSAFIVEYDQFTSVGRQGEIGLPSGTTRVNLAGKTVMPA
jgi:hypothetical protein